MGGFAAHAAGVAHGLVQAVQKALALLGHELRDQRLRFVRELAQLAAVVQEHGGQALAFALAGLHQGGEGLVGQSQEIVVAIGHGDALAAGELQDLGHAERGGLGQPSLNTILQTK